MKEQLKQIFDENADCKTDTWDGIVLYLKEGQTVPAMTESTFIDIVSELMKPTDTWIEIKSEDDLPKDEGYYWVINSFDDIFIEDFSPKDIIDRDIWLDHRTHYQPIHKPQPPKP